MLNLKKRFYQQLYANSYYFVIAESTLMFASHGNQIGLAKLVQGYSLSNSGGHYIATNNEGRKSIKLKLNEIVLQVLI